MGVKVPKFLKGANNNEKVPHLNKLGVKYKRCQEVSILYQDLIFTGPQNNYMMFKKHIRSDCQIKGYSLAWAQAQLRLSLK